MKQVYFGRTGLKVSELCLGAMTFGRENTEAESRTLLDRYVAAGGTFIDTSDAYGAGLSEEILGRWLKGQDRDRLVVATKVRWATGEGPNQRGLSRKRILQAAEASLKRLQTPHIDLYQLHGWDEGTPLEETLSALNDLVQKGMVLYVGISNFSGWQLQKAIDMAKQHGWTLPVSLQPQYNLLCRETEWELLQVCKQEGLALLPWSPLRGGWLSGKYQRGIQGPPADSRVEAAEQHGWGESWKNYNNERTWRVLDALHQVARDAGKTPAQVAINWLLCQQGVTSPIIGARNPGQLEDNLGSTGWQLDSAHLNLLTEASHVEPPYPYGLLKDPDRARTVLSH